MTNWKKMCRIILLLWVVQLIPNNVAIEISRASLSHFQSSRTKKRRLQIDISYVNFQTCEFINKHGRKTWPLPTMHQISIIWIQCAFLGKLKTHLYVIDDQASKRRKIVTPFCSTIESTFGSVQGLSATYSTER